MKIIHYIQDGTVYGIGLNTHGQLGLGNTKDCQRATPITCLRGSPIVFIACGAYHSLIICKSGFVKFLIEIFIELILFFRTVFTCGLNA